ncbi:MAG: DUF1254 domain-containing protein [Betaproteobacteria bacterium]|nr:DUF1254 domain-containing protein [Betaproteobacteria bacterium]
MRISNKAKLAGGAICLALLSACGGKDDAVSQAAKKDAVAGVPVPGIAEVKAIAEEAFVYGLPIVMNYGVMYEFVLDKNSGQWKAPFNVISNSHRVFTYEDTAIPTPNSDTPYSLVWLDLRAEPMVVSVPAVDPKRYYSVMLNDGNTFNYGYIGSRATGSDAGSYLIAGPRWKGEAPQGIKKVFQATTDFSLAVFRTQLFDAKDMPNVEAVQAGYKVQPLSAFLNQPAPPAAPEVAWPKFDKELVKTEFLDFLDLALQFAPAGPEEEAIRARLASIGIGPGKKFAFKDLSLEHKAAILLGMKEGDKKVDEKVASLGKHINGWHVGSAFGDRAFYKGDWLLRAAAARAGIYGNDAVEAMYPMTKTLADGTPLDGSKDKYTLTFAKDQFPPVNAFWSVTMYDGKSQLLVKNPINRYLINSPMLPNLKKNADGSLTLYIQKDSPGKDKESNWLPAPDGPIYLVLRLYWPKTENPSILPAGEGTWQPPALVKAS